MNPKAIKREDVMVIHSFPGSEFPDITLLWNASQETDSNSHKFQVRDAHLALPVQINFLLQIFNCHLEKLTEGLVQCITFELYPLTGPSSG